MTERRRFLQASGAAGLALAAHAFAALAADDPSRVALVVGNNAYPQSPLGARRSRSRPASLTHSGSRAAAIPGTLGEWLVAGGLDGEIRELVYAKQYV